MTQQLKQTPLYQEHVALNARMVPFGGWEMPVQYEGILAEYEATRNKCTLFDTSHMGEFSIEGDIHTTGLDRLVTMSIDSMPIKSCRYGMLCNEDGGVIDDLIVFREDQEKWFIVVNGATKDKDKEHFLKHLKQTETFKDISDETAKLDVQGPLARDVLSPLVSAIEKLDFYAFDYFDLLGERVLISRTGYTGELGYEIYYPADGIVKLWKELLKNANVSPAGLGARDVLRLEVGYSLYGHELTDQINPLEAGLSRFINFEKDFIGKKSLLKEKENGVKRKLVGFVSDSRRAPREGNLLFSDEESEIGIVTSGTFAPAMNKGIGLGFIQNLSAKKGEKIIFGNEKNKNPAIITERIFYKEGSLKS